MNLIGPIVLITVLTTFTFMLPVETVDRTAVAVTFMLTVTVFMHLVVAMMPETSDCIPLVGYFFMFSLMEIFCIIVSLGYVNNVYNRTKADKPMSSFTRRYVFNKLSFILGTRYDHQSAARSVITSLRLMSLDGLISNIDLKVL